MDAPHPRETEHLVTAAVGEDRTVPPDEPMETARARDDVIARLEVEVIRIAQDDLGPDVFHVALSHRLHRPARPDGHESRRLHHAVRCLQLAATRATVGRDHREPEHVVRG